jgi:Ca2+-binding EF-hand superfamily protein
MTTAGFDVYSTLDPSGLLDGDQALCLKATKAYGISVGLVDEPPVLVWPWPSVRAFTHESQTVDPSDMELLIVALEGGEKYEFEVDNGAQVEDYIQAAKKDYKAATSSFARLAAFLPEEELDRLQAGLHLARSAIGYSQPASKETGLFAPPRSVRSADMLGALRAFNTHAHLDDVMSSMGGEATPYDDFLTFVGNGEVGFEEHNERHFEAMAAAGVGGGTALERAQRLSVADLRTTFDRVNESRSGAFDAEELAHALRKMGVAHTEHGCEGLVQHLSRCRVGEGRLGNSVRWLEWVEGVASGAVARTAQGRALLEKSAMLTASVCFTYPVAQPPPTAASEAELAALPAPERAAAHAVLPEETALVFHDGLGGLKIMDAGDLHGKALASFPMALIEKFDLKPQSDDPEDMELLTMQLLDGRTFTFEVEEAAELARAKKNADEDCVRIVRARRDGAHILSPLQQATLRSVFDVFDVNGDGVVTANELRLIFRVIGTDLDWEMMFTKLDVDGNGHITLDELTSVIVFETAVHGESEFLNTLSYDVLKVREAFTMIDIDGTGELGRDEMRMVLRALGRDIDGDRLEIFMTLLDVDCSGTVEWTEFLHAIAGGELDSPDLRLADLFKPDTVAQLERAKLEHERRLKASRAKREVAEREAAELQSRLRQLEEAEVTAAGSTAKMMKMAMAQAKTCAARLQASVLDAAKAAARGRLERERTLRALAVESSVIMGWTIRVTVDGLRDKTALVAGVSKARKGKPTMYQLRFDKPFPAEYPDGTASLCLDRKEPRSGKRILQKKGGESKFHYIKFPFVLLGDGAVGAMAHYQEAGLRRSSSQSVA